MLEYKNTEQFLSDYRSYLIEKGITNTHVARKIGISPQQLQNVFKKKELTVSDVIKLCNAIDYNCKIMIE
ncbi:XRE family transcriptional regulator [Mediterraneibacter gnavus]|jgi:DNA-binding Xre family transcriptional regulator|uniref:helix-turn-helix domain-containing protein n=1 Tax=Mediterraneibacter gnavus TaxID=33038 RepID=UPI000E55131F|nr:helix-turn-helix transcriptional regulator [Mediterraneibacter gnavus]RHE72454.1 XRE family transcriptional regulator [Mediterraneibacter gnavus]DAV74758.1 MAG TPA: Helix-turn-helix XRE-family like protein [Caudoviricetes sp.]